MDDGSDTVQYKLQINAPTCKHQKHIQIITNLILNTIELTDPIKTQTTHAIYLLLLWISQT